MSVRLYWNNELIRVYNFSGMHWKHTIGMSGINQTIHKQGYLSCHCTGKESWYKPNGDPVLLADVPKHLRILDLLLR